jgi:hypothetical protein
MKSLFNKIFRKDRKKYTEKTFPKPLPTKLKLENLNDKEVDYLQNNIGLAGEIMKDLGLENIGHTQQEIKFKRGLWVNHVYLSHSNFVTVDCAALRLPARNFI